MTATATDPGHVQLELRPYQVEALDRVDEAEGRGVRRQLLCAATGLGKTVLFATLAERRRQRALVIAHRDELIVQAAAKILEVWPGLGATPTVHQYLIASGDPALVTLAERAGINRNGVGIVKARTNDCDAHVVVASVQTLSRGTRLERLAGPADGDALFEADRPEPFGLVVVDEAHHAAAETYGRILTHLRAGAEDGPLLLGVTATPDRGDGKGLDTLFDEVVASYDILWGIRAGYLADLRGLAVVLEDFDLDSVKVRRGDYDQGQAGRMMAQAHVEATIVEAWQRHGEGRKTLVFTPTVDVAHKVADAFTAAGVSAAMVSGATPMDERRQILRRFSSGEITVLANCAVLTEGYDEPTIACVVVARPTKSRALYVQMVGRGTRRHPDKADCLVLDIVGAASEHSLITVPSLFGIEKNAREMSDASTLLSDAMADEEAHLIKIGRMRADEVELFSKVRAGGIAWVATHDPGEMRRWVRALGRDPRGFTQPTVVIAERPPGDIYTAGLQFADGTKRVLIGKVPLETAQAVAEDYVRKAGAGGIADIDAPWRSRPPKPGQLRAARKWRLQVDPAWTGGELADALDAHITRIRDRRARHR